MLFFFFFFLIWSSGLVERKMAHSGWMDDVECECLSLGLSRSLEV